MQRISRIYVCNFGSDTAWYDQHLLDLNDPETLEPTDVVFNLENGGGKTSLIAFILSCFDPNKDRWLQHLQKKSHRFSEYFAWNGPLAFIVIEWLMPSRTADGEDYRLIVGQAVAIKEVLERGAESERWFFAFESTDGLGLDSFPAPGLGSSVTRDMPEFVKWMHDASRISRGELYATKSQDDWVKHLAGRLIDVELIRMQVDFNSNEGGIEEGFLTFNSEQEFLRRFLSLTLDPEKSAVIRESLAKTVDKLKAKPRYEQQREQLYVLRAAMIPFVDAAGAFETALVEHSATRRFAAGVALTIRERREHEVAAAAERERFAVVQEEVGESSRRNAQWKRSDATVMQKLLYQRAVNASKASLDDATLRLEQGRHRLRLIEAADAKFQMDLATQHVSELSDQLAEKHKGLKPLRDKAALQGTLLRAALASASEHKQSMAKQEGLKAEDCVLRLKQIDAELTEIHQAIGTLSREEGELKAFEQHFAQQRGILERDGILQISDASVSPVIAALLDRLERNSLLHETLLAQQEELERNETKIRDDATAEDSRRLEAQSRQREKREYVAQAEGIADSLSQSPILRDIVEDEYVDPDGEGVEESLCKLISQSDMHISRCDVRSNALKMEQESITETGLAGRSVDVAAVLSALENEGVRSAIAANRYVAEIVPQGEKARSLVLSDPARFLGVSIAGSEFDRARSILERQDLNLLAPVTIGVNARTAEDPRDGVFVIGPSTDAAFNKEAAANALAIVDAELGAVDAERRHHHGQRTQAVDALSRLRDYLARFGAARVREAELDRRRFEAEEESAIRRISELDELLQQTKAQIRELVERLRSLPASIAADERAISRLQDFESAYERPADEKRRRRAEIESLVQDYQSQTTIRAESRIEIETARTLALVAQNDFEKTASELDSRRVGVVHFDEKREKRGGVEIQDEPLQALQQRYDDAVAIMMAEEKDRLGLVSERLNQARSEEARAKQTFNQFSDLSLNEIERLGHVDFTYEKGQQSVLNVRIENEKGNAQIDFGERKSEFEGFCKMHRDVPIPAAETVALSDDELTVAIRNCEEQAVEFDSVAASANQAAQDAREDIIKRENAADGLKTLGELLSAAIPYDPRDAEIIQISTDAQTYVHSLMSRFRIQKESVDTAREEARQLFHRLTGAAGSRSMAEVEPELSRDISESDFEMACSDRRRILELVIDRIATVSDTLESMVPDFESSVGELYNLTHEGLSILSVASSKVMPASAPYVGGKQILTMRAKFTGINVEARKEAIRRYLNELIKSGIVPAKGADLVAQSLVEIAGSKDLDIRILKMEQNEAHQYQSAGELKGSKGQGSVIAMFLYLLINQIRAETQAGVKRAGGGPLILDNPFAKVQTRALIDAQRLLAKAIGVQLLFFTANADPNILSGFRRVIRLRKSMMNSKTKRSHIEMVSATFRDLGSVSENLT